MGSGERAADRIKRRKPEAEEAPVAEFKNENPLGSLMVDTMNKKGQIDVAKLEEILQEVSKDRKADLSQIAPEMKGHVETALVDLIMDAEDETEKLRLSDMLDRLQGRPDSHEREVTKVLQKAEMAAAPAREDARFVELFKQLENMETDFQNRRTSIEDLKQTKGFFGRMFSGSLRNQERELRDLEKMMNDTRDQLEGLRNNSTARPKERVVSSLKDRGRRAAGGNFLR